MARLFIACDLPPLIKQRLDLIASGLPGAKWVSPHSHHITLCFLGDAPPPQLSDVVAALAPIKCPEMTLKFDGFNTFGDKKLRNLHIKLTMTEELKVLQRSISHAMRQIGFEIEARRFVPHVTLARLKTTDALSVARYVEAMSPLALPPLKVRGYTLFESHLAHTGAVYDPVCEFGGDNDIANGEIDHQSLKTGPYLAVDNSPSTASSSISRT